jgi:uncharacterized protein YcbK (DUF882 family)
MHVASIVLLLMSMHPTVTHPVALINPTVPALHRSHGVATKHTAPRKKSGHHLRAIRWTPLKGSHDALVRANKKANTEDLERIQNDVQLQALTRNKALVGLPLGRTLLVDARLPEDRRYCRPWTASFLQQLGTDYYSIFKHPVQVNSAVRTAEYQEQLRHRNGNAAPGEGDTASLHLTGATVDISKASMGRKQLKWTRDYLLKLQKDGLVEVAEEFRQRVFHIMVYKDYEAKMQPPEEMPDVP